MHPPFVDMNTVLSNRSAVADTMTLQHMPYLALLLPPPLRDTNDNGFPVANVMTGQHHRSTDEIGKCDTSDAGYILTLGNTFVGSQPIFPSPCDLLEVLRMWSLRPMR